MADMNGVDPNAFDEAPVRAAGILPRNQPAPALDFEIKGEPAALFAALAKAQAAFAEVHRTASVRITTKTGGSYEFQYAPLEDILAATRPALAANGLCLLQPLSGGKGTYTLRSILGHSSGASLVMTIVVPSNGSEIKELGSAITYLRRYTVQALLGIAAEEDDDGSAAAGDGYERKPRAYGNSSGATKPTPPAKPVASEGDYETMLDAIGKSPNTEHLAQLVKAVSERSWTQPQQNALNKAYQGRKKALQSPANDAQEAAS